MAYTVTTDDPKILNLCSDDEVNTVLQAVRSVLVTRKGTVPMDREYGLSQDFLDMPINDAIPLIVSEVRESLENCVPNVSVQDVNAESGEDGRIIISVNVEVVDDESSD